MSDAPTPRQAHMKEYNSWKAMRSRCANPRNVSYRYYGAKGVTVCGRWAVFAAFLADVGPAPGPEYQLERLDCAGGYEPGNVVWATPAEQQANTDKVRLLTARGVTLPLCDWARLSGVHESTIRSRIDDLGWSVERAVFTGTNSQFGRKNRKAGRPPAAANPAVPHSHSSAPLSTA